MELETKRFLDSAVQEIILLDTDLNITEINSACMQLTGAQREEIAGEPITTLWSSLSIRKLKEDLNRDRVFEGEIHEVSLGGDPRPVHYVVSPIRDEIRQVLGYACFGRPITDIDHYERELRRERAREPANDACADC